MSSQTASSPMKNIAISKVVINIGVGRSGEPVEKAKRALNVLTGQRPKVCGAKNTVRDFGIHKGEPIGAMVTLRRDKAVEFIKRVIAAKGNIIKASSFDDFGNLSIGIHEHIDIPGTRYDPEIGIFGMDVCMALSRPGYRISRRRNKSSIGKNHRIKREDAIGFLKQSFGVEIA
ncbi:MAG TPA: 50S ribosomal protein L5 [Nitrososphaeraceae archaeon]|jgi:large subunit ribosomal protein L5|nr:50S ribosomal protein L5 [Thermoproteota archaeon]HEV2876904.1 50S ribosomal protein L5 [Nitrososphaeraceae archaeon]